MVISNLIQICQFFFSFRRRVTVRCQSLWAQSPMDKGLDLQNNPLFWGHCSCQWSNERAQSDWLSWKISCILLLSLGIYFCMSNWNSGLQWSHRRVQVILIFFVLFYWFYVSTLESVQDLNSGLGIQTEIQLPITS